MTNLSPQTQTIIDAADEVFSNGGTIREGFAAALREVVNQLQLVAFGQHAPGVVMCYDILELCDELEVL